jgi:hypothetical protein
MSNLIPYLIIEARPNSYLPHVNCIKGIIEEKNVESHLFNLLIKFIKEQTTSSNINTIEQIKMFWNYFYSASCMKNKHWEAFIIKNNSWESVLFTDEEILDGLINKKKYIENDEIIEGDISLEGDILLEGDEIIESDEIIENNEIIQGEAVRYYISSDEDE